MRTERILKHIGGSAKREMVIELNQQLNKIKKPEQIG